MKKNPGRKEWRWEMKKRRKIPIKAVNWKNHREQVVKNREHKQLLKKLIPYWAHKNEEADNGQDT